MISSPDARSRVTVLAGLSAPATEATARHLMATAGHPLILLSHDLSGVRDGLVYRSVRTAGELLESGLTEMTHGCASCTLREDILPTLTRLSRQFPGVDILLALPPAIEPESIAAAAALAGDAVRFDSFCPVVDAATLLDDLTGTASLRDRGLDAADNDERTVADVLCHQIEFADTLVIHGDTADPRVDTLAHRLAPWAVRARFSPDSGSDLAGEVLRTGRHNPAVPGMPGRALEGYPVGVHAPAAEHGVTALVFQSRRPFHSQRLHDALDELTSETLRGVNTKPTHHAPNARPSRIHPAPPPHPPELTSSTVTTERAQSRSWYGPTVPGAEPARPECLDVPRRPLWYGKFLSCRRLGILGAVAPPPRSDPQLPVPAPAATAWNQSRKRVGVLP